MRHPATEQHTGVIGNYRKQLASEFAPRCRHANELAQQAIAASELSSRTTHALVAEMLAAGITHREIARALGLSRGRIYQINEVNKARQEMSRQTTTGAR